MANQLVFVLLPETVTVPIVGAFPDAIFFVSCPIATRTVIVSSFARVMGDPSKVTVTLRVEVGVPITVKSPVARF